MSHKYDFHHEAACSLAVKYLCISYLVSIMTGNDVLCAGVWNRDIILNYHNFYSILRSFLLSICSNLYNSALVIHLLILISQICVQLVLLRVYVSY